MTAYLREHYLRKHLPAAPILIVGSSGRLANLQADIIRMIGGSSGSQACDLLAERVELLGTRPVTGSTSWS